MNNQLQIFSNPEFGQIRTMQISDEQVWFVGKDVADVLGYARSADAIRKHVDDEDKGVFEMATPGGRQPVIFINESGLYSLILSSKLPKAREFKHWVTSEVLPTIRKHGAYLTKDTIERAVREPDFLIKLANTIKEERRQKELYVRKCAEQSAEIKKYEKQSIYVNYVLQCPDLVNINQIAQDYGLSAQVLNAILQEHSIQYKCNEQWILYAKHKGKGYVHSTTHITPTGRVVLHTKWTQKGRLFLYYMLKSWGYLPTKEQEERERQMDLFSMNYGG